MKRKIAAVFIMGALLLGGCATDNKDISGKEQTPRAVPGQTIKLKDINLAAKGITLSGYNYDLKLSPDGKSVAFSGYSLEQGEEIPENKLVLADLNSGETRVFDGVGQVLAWLKDGKGILYADDSSIGILDIYSGESKKIENERTHAALSPDGSTVAYTVRGQEVFPWVKKEDPRPEAGLWLYDIETGGKKRLTRDADAWYPVWYPDGKKLFYFCDLGKELGDGAGHLQGMAVISADGGRPQVFEQKQGKFRAAGWIVPAKSLHIIEGWDDGYFHSTLDLEQGKYVALEDNMGVEPYPVAVAEKKGWLVKAGHGKVEIMEASGNKVNEFSLPEEGQKVDSLIVAPGSEKMAFIISRSMSGPDGMIEGNRVMLASFDGKNFTNLTSNDKNNLSILWDREGNNVITLQSERFEGSEKISAVKVLPAK